MGGLEQEQGRHIRGWIGNGKCAFFLEFLKTKQIIIPPYMAPQGSACLVYASFCLWLHDQTGNNTSVSAAQGFSFYGSMNSLLFFSNCISEPLMKQSIVAKIRHPLDDVAICILSTAKIQRWSTSACVCVFTYIQDDSMILDSIWFP